MLSYIIFVIVSLLAILGYYIYNIRKSNYFTQLIDQIPGPPRPFFGNIFNFTRNPQDLWRRFREYNKEYYPIYRNWGSYIATVNILCPEDIEIILSNIKHTQKSLLYRCLESWLGTGLLTSSGTKWQNRRKILTPTFHFSILQQYLGIFARQSDAFVERLKNECDKPYTFMGPFVEQFTLSSICETAMGTRLDYSKKVQKDYVKAIHRMGKIIVYRIVRPWLYFESIYRMTSTFREQKNLEKVLHNFSMSIIEERKGYYSQEPAVFKKRMSMLDLLLLSKISKQSIDDLGIREEVDTFMFEGHDTTAACLGFTMMLLANHKNVQDKIFEEIQETLGQSNRRFTYGDLQSLGYLERVLKESLRMYPSVPFIGRITGEEVITYTGYRIPANCYVNIHIYDLHYNADIYPEPYKFDPDRFLPDNTKQRHPFAYLPFSAGPRNCIGQKFAMLELKTVVATIVKNYILEPIDKPNDLTLTSDLVLRSIEKIRVKIRYRDEHCK